MLLTIGIPTYTRSAYLREMIYSVAQQIEEHHLQDVVEIVVGDNVSTDDTELMVNGLINSGKKYIKYFRNEANLGSVRNLLRTLENASGNFYMFYGDDDLMCKGSLINILQQIQEYNNIPVFVFRQKGYQGITESKLITTYQCASSFFYYMGNACAAVNTKMAQDNLKKYYDIIVSTCWPQTHLMYLSMYDSGLDKTVMASALEVYETQPKNNNNIPNAFYYYDSQFYAMIRLAKIIADQRDPGFYKKIKKGVPALNGTHFIGFVVYVTNLDKFYSIGNERNDYKVTLNESWKTVKGSYRLYIIPFLLLRSFPLGLYKFLYIKLKCLYYYLKQRNGRSFGEINRQINKQIELNRNTKFESAKQKHSITVNRGQW